jgi:hypothetical protein
VPFPQGSLRGVAIKTRLNIYLYLVFSQPLEGRHSSINSYAKLRLIINSHPLKVGPGAVFLGNNQIFRLLPLDIKSRVIPPDSFLCPGFIKG